MSFTDTTLHEALHVLGAILLDRGNAYEIVVIGGGALLLLDLIHRSTKDLDVLAWVDGTRWIEAQPLPGPLLEAIREVSGALGLESDWLNTGPSDLLRSGLPAGFAERTIVRKYGGLTVRIASRFDQIAFKLYASVDHGLRSRHFADLRALLPTQGEIREVAAWCLTQDVSEPFNVMLIETMEALEVEGEHG